MINKDERRYKIIWQKGKKHIEEKAVVERKENMIVVVRVLEKERNNKYLFLIHNTFKEIYINY